MKKKVGKTIFSLREVLQMIIMQFDNEQLHQDAGRKRKTEKTAAED